MTQTISLTKSELKILQAIDAAPDKVLDWSACGIAANLTPRGRRTVLNRLIDCRLIAPSETPATYRWPTLTYKGMLALRASQEPGMTQTLETALAALCAEHELTSISLNFTAPSSGREAYVSAWAHRGDDCENAYADTLGQAVASAIVILNAKRNRVDAVELPALELVA